MRESEPAEPSSPAEQLSQRERILNAVIATTAQSGHEATTVTQITARAHVSRTTFYEHFTDKLDCFLAAYRAQAERLTNELTRALAQDNARTERPPADHGAAKHRAGESPPEQRWQVAVQTLLEFAEREPAAFAVLSHEALVAGPKAMDERDRLIAKLEQILERTWMQALTHTGLPDLPPKLLLGAVLRLTSIRMRRGERHPTRLLADFTWWAQSYAASVGKYRRRGPTPTSAMQATGATRGPPPADPPSWAAPPAPLPKGRRRSSAQSDCLARAAREVQRERIVYAIAQTIRQKGYAEITVADITVEAGLSREVFYENFVGKREAFLATHKLVFEQVMAASAGAFFTASTTWPQRVWDSALTVVHFAATRPGFAHFGYVEPYALGRAITGETDECLLAFTIFLNDGYRWDPCASNIPSLAGQAIACALMELCAHYIRDDRGAELYALLPLIAHTILTPFMGADANAFIESKLSEDARRKDPKIRDD
jgi:AcrR family transcriptional regulator